jgi:uncharacterized caspase-like protein
VERRIALVIGNAAYAAGALNTSANDAGLIAQTLEAAGFEVIGARDIDQDALRRAFRDFVDKAATLGPDDVAVVYLGGYGLQLEGENYFVPIDARIERASDVPVQAVRLSDYTRALAALKLKASIVVLDLARSHPFAPNEPLAGGLALVEPEPGMLIAFNAAPGTIAPAAEGAYGPYAKALAEMMREGGLRAGAVACLQCGGLVCLLRAHGRCPAFRCRKRGEPSTPLPADPGSRCAGGIYRSLGTRRAAGLFGVS